MFCERVILAVSLLCTVSSAMDGNVQKWIDIQKAEPLKHVLDLLSDFQSLGLLTEQGLFRRYLKEQMPTREGPCICKKPYYGRVCEDVYPRRIVVLGDYYMSVFLPAVNSTEHQDVTNLVQYESVHAMTYDYNMGKLVAFVRHGQLHFPGGKVEASDVSTAGGDAIRAQRETMMRKVKEETGIEFTWEDAANALYGKIELRHGTRHPVVWGFLDVWGEQFKPGYFDEMVVVDSLRRIDTHWFGLANDQLFQFHQPLDEVWPHLMKQIKLVAPHTEVWGTENDFTPLHQEDMKAAA